MAVTSIKSTYSLDPETVRRLERMAERWKVSKSEALRRAIRAASAEGTSGGAAGALDALDQLQRTLGLSPAQARGWAAEAHKERQASSTPARSRRPA
jgi:hypothetical protein